MGSSMTVTERMTPTPDALLKSSSPRTVLVCLHVVQEKDERKLSELASCLGISAEEASKLRVGQGTSSMSSAEEEEAIF